MEFAEEFDLISEFRRSIFFSSSFEHEILR
jgi:hypothetical protein